MRTAAAAAEAARRNSDEDEIPGLTRPKLRARSSAMIGDVAIQLGFAEKARVDSAIDAARLQGKRTGQVLVESGVLTHDQLSRVLAERLGLDHVDLSVYPVDMGAVGLIDLEVAKRYQAVPIQFLEDRRLLLAMADPSNLLTIDDVTMMTGLKVQPTVASLDDIRGLLAKQQRLDESVEGIEETEEVVDPLGEEGTETEAPAIRLVHSIIAQAVEQGASDVHFDPEERELKVRFRIDGVMADAGATIQREPWPGGRLAREDHGLLDISERRLPQDGRMAVERRRPPDRPAHRHPAARRAARAWSCASSTRPRRRSPSSGSACCRRRTDTFARRSSATAAPCSSPGRPARARRRRCTP